MCDKLLKQNDRQRLVSSSKLQFVDSFYYIVPIARHTQAISPRWSVLKIWNIVRKKMGLKVGPKRVLFLQKSGHISRNPAL